MIQQLPNLTMIDLFAGCGGLSLGMENAGFTPVFVSELSPDAMGTYLANRHHIIGGKPFSEQTHLHCNNANDLQGERLEKMVRDLSLLGLSFPKKNEAKKGVGYSNLDLLAGGPPCQGYSGIGHRRSYAVDKKDLPSNQLYVGMANIIRRLRPRIFLFENVRGILTSKWTREGDDKIWPDVWKEFRSISGYCVRYTLVRASDYGVPQNRPRVFLVGIREDIAQKSSLINLKNDDVDAVRCGFLPAPNSLEVPDLEDLLSDLVDKKVTKILETQDFKKGAFTTTRYPLPPQTKIQEQLRALPLNYDNRSNELTDHEYSKHALRIVNKFQHMIIHGEIPENAKTKKFAQKVLPKKWVNGRPTITVTSMPDDYVHYCQPRILTVREWARLQLFPDWYKFSGKRTTGGIRRAGNPQEGIFDREVPKYTQIGNAVPVGLAENVGKYFKKIIEDSLKNAGKI
ncbi:DNA cytosine methyltransferase [Acetobacter indonesiensis]|uniref:DNA cytosine methyltransferase n=1 Tax=Acetobacter indonesiensis TaxID=104101 RepID=UPI0020A59E51|nr:DNA cytosine methyltransferase [Acetobacter indonesiensis]MCP1232037.1 DNA cytosine methyltransferase [Acetobacter indonesiensis]